MVNRTIKFVVFCIVLIGYLWIFDLHCPMESILGIPCPGCNMSSALYWLLVKQDVETAYMFHPVVFLLIPYLMYVAIVWIRQGMQGFYKKSFRYISMLFVGVLLLCYVYRMITVFPQWPMQVNKEALLIKIISLF